MKICSMCKQSKDESCFARKTKKKNGDIVLQWHCKECHAVYRRQHYQNNRKKYIKKASTRSNKHKLEVFQFLIDYFKTHPCVDCGEDNPLVLEFDHVIGSKHATISYLAASSSHEKMMKEIAKCNVRCANCHRIQTAIRGKWRMVKLLND